MPSSQTIDYIMLACLCLAFIRGVRSGLLKSVINPIAFIAGLFIAYIYYAQTNKLLEALTIAFFSPIAIKIIYSIVLKIFIKISQDEDNLSVASRLAGGFICLSWSAVQAMLMLILLAMIPLRFGWLDHLQKNIVKSQSYKAANFLMLNFGGNLQANDIVKILDDPSKLNVIEHSTEYKEVMNNHKVRDFLNDQDSMKNIKEKNFTQLLTDKKFQSILNDKDLLAKFLELGHKMGRAKDPEILQDIP